MVVFDITMTWKQAGRCFEWKLQLMVLLVTPIHWNIH